MNLMSILKASAPVVVGLFIAANIQGFATKANVPVLKQLANGTLLSGG